MSFLNNLVNEFTHHGQGSQQQSQGGYGQQQQQYGGGYPEQSYNNERPNPPEPWIAEWDGPAGRWIFINRQTGERSFDLPRDGGYGGGYPPQPQGYNSQQPYYEGEPPKKDHSTRNTALGVAAGLAGGALLMHEGEKIEDRWDEDKYRAEERIDDARYGIEDRYEEDKYRMEDRVDDGIQDVQDFPEDAARWTGRKVQEVEDIPDDVERKWDNAVQDVEDVPEDVAGWVGGKVGDVERFGDNMDNAYDDGRDQARYDDGW